MTEKMETSPVGTNVQENWKHYKYSVVIPVFNSEGIVAETIDRTRAFFNTHGLNYELILVNDASTDGSWQIIREKAQEDPRTVGIHLLRNYGQHTAIFCGLEKSTGDYVITLDDDLQNPPGEIIRLIEKVHEGNYDFVAGKFRNKRHPLHRRLGSLLIGKINNKIFGKPENFVVSNFRILRRDVVDRICAYRSAYPYITGLALWCSTNRANALVEHEDRPVGQSSYDWYKIGMLVMRVLFNYSGYPLYLVAGAGIVISLMSFFVGMFFAFKGLFLDVPVPGWVLILVFLSFVNAFTLLVVAMLGAYVLRVVRQTSSSEIYNIKEVAGPGK